MGQVPECLSPESRIGYAPWAMEVVENAINLKSVLIDYPAHEFPIGNLRYFL